jgi:(p)ppGpp synthase/HD superfamily hydrolase
MKRNAIDEALDLAVSAHKGQVDKAGAPYIWHVVRVALAQPDELRTVVALLHDVVEDTDIKLLEIHSRFGREVADAVHAITKRSGESLAAYLERVRANATARAVKLADIADNSDPIRLGTLPEADRRRLQRKYEDALHALA